MDLEIKPAGDRALVCQFENIITPETNEKVCALSRLLEESGINGVKELQPTYRSLTVIYDPYEIKYQALCNKITDLAVSSAKAGKAPSRQRRIPCCYGGHFGPELERTAKHAGLSREEVIFLHSSAEYKVYMLGFLPGFVYLGGLAEKLYTPRLDTPRLKIPAGSVGIGGSQTGVYPVESPGGWNIIGATPLNFYDPSAEEPILCKAGDILKFVPVTSCDYYDIRQELLKGVCTWA